MKRPNWTLVTAAREAAGTLHPSTVRRILDGGDLDDELAAFSRRGYHFKVSPKGGVKLVDWPRRLFAEEIRTDLGTETVGRRVEVHWRVSSTSDLARDDARRGREGVVHLAEEQARGRGRFGRVWRAGRFTSLLFSTALMPPDKRIEARGLMLAGAVAVAEALRETLGLSAEIRWPNDVLVEGRKVSGVLVEGFSGKGGRWLVVGTGVNVNIAEGDFPQELQRSAGSLSIFAGRRVDRALVVRAILRRSDFWWELLKADGYQRLSDTWRSLSSILGRFITLRSAGRNYRGRVVDLDARFGLVLQMAGGPTRVFEPSRTTLLRDE